MAIDEPPALLAVVVALPVASAAASLLAIAIGAHTGERARMAALDLLTLSSAFLAALLLSLPMGRDVRAVVGVLFVIVLALRLAPSLWMLLAGRERSALAAFMLAFTAYAPLAVWQGAAAAAQGDQPHYLLAADRLARGSLDVGPAYADDALFRELTGGLRVGPGDLETHVARTPRGDRLVQGYALSLVLTPGWMVGGKNGALVTLAFVGALASLGTFLLCRDVLRDPRRGASAWTLVTFLAPMPALVGAIYPNMLGAAAIVWAYRWLFTAPRRRPLLAGLVAGLTLFLTPRDGITVLLLLPFLVLVGKRAGLRFSLALGASAVAAAMLGAVVYGVPLPYAGYGFGIDMAQRLDAQPTLTYRADVGLPGILFDRAFGLAGSAPYVFIGLVGAGVVLRGSVGTFLALIRARRLALLDALSPDARALLPALAATAGSILALSLYRLWQGGWAPPNRYLVEVLPLWAPFVGLGLARLRAPAGVLVVWTLVGLSLLATALMLAIPTLAYNLSDTARVVDVTRAILPLSPLAWLPSFEAANLRALALAWLSSVPLWIAFALLVRHGVRAAR